MQIHTRITQPGRGNDSRGLAARSELTPLVAGALATSALVVVVGQFGALATGAAFGSLVFLAVVAGFVYVPWITIAAAIPLYALLPTLRVFVNPQLGALKDLVSLAAVAGAAVLLVQRRAARRSIQVDGTVLVLIALIVALYLANLGGSISGETGYGTAWFHSVRLFCQPLSLLAVGLLVRDPARTFRAAATSMIVTAVVVALYGLLQQVMTADQLVSLGYSYGDEVRFVNGKVRSFGTLSEPFSYAGFLLIGLAVALLWSRRGLLTNVAIAVVSLGVLVSYVRTAAVISIALLGLALARNGHRLLAALLIFGSTVAAMIFLLVASQQATPRAVQVTSTSYLTLNGRTEAWQSQIGGSTTGVLFGRGVGATGTAAERAQRTLEGKQQLNSTSGDNVVDSGYLAMMADVGIIGLALLLILFVRLLRRAWDLGRRGAARGWGAAGVLVVIMLDAMSRESLTGFPTAYIGMLLVGLGLAITAEESDGGSPAADAG